MLSYLTRHALRLSSLSLALAVLGFLAVAPTPAKAVPDACSAVEPANFPTNLTTGVALANGMPISGCTAIINVDNNGVFSVQQNVNTAYDNSGDSIIAFTNGGPNSVYDLYIWGAAGKPIFDSSRPSDELLCNFIACAPGASGDEGLILNSLDQIIGYVLFTDIGTVNAPGVVCSVDNCADILFDIGGNTSAGLPSGDTAIFGLTEPQFSAEESPPTPVPEPGSFGVLGTGLLGLGLYRFLRRRRVWLRLQRQQPPPVPLTLKPQQS